MLAYELNKEGKAFIDICKRLGNNGSTPVNIQAYMEDYLGYCMSVSDFFDLADVLATFGYIRKEYVPLGFNDGSGNQKIRYILVRNMIEGAENNVEL